MEERKNGTIPSPLEKREASVICRDDDDIVSYGSRGGPGSAINIELPAAVVSDVYSQYTSNVGGVEEMRAFRGPNISAPLKAIFEMSKNT
jgi:hypothetical protein